jgi:3-phosphoshikimate 1-carboxyvinyltransferase
MKAIISPAKISGTITAPASKSAMQRACAAALLKGGETHLYNYGISNDDKAALGIIQRLGAEVRYEEDKILIRSNSVRPIDNTIDCGESGLSVRMFTSIAALSDQQITITGSGSLLKRPQAFFNEVLPQLGVQVESNNGFLPLKIQGPLQPKEITTDGSLSSQFLTGLLFAYSASNADAIIHVTNLNSKPYIDLTLKMLNDFGLAVPQNNNYQSFVFKQQLINQSTNQPLSYHIEGDWSGAAFVLVAGAIAGNIVVKGLDVFSTQADKAILQALIQSKAIMSIEEKQIEIRESKLQAFHVNATDCPDLFPPLVALAAYCDGTSVIEGVNRLTHKESNRALTLQEEFGKLGVVIKLQDDLMIIEGGSDVKGATIHSHHDHRIAMACAVAALKAKGNVTIEDADAINKSYPAFWEHLQKLNALVSLNHN